PAPSASSSASAAAASASPTAAAAASSAAAPAEPSDTSAYSVVVEAPDDVSLTAMKGGGIASISSVLFSLGEGPLAQEPLFMRGIKKGEWGSVLGGEWPKSAWIKVFDAEGK